jgi:hypothetical protein
MSKAPEELNHQPIKVVLDGSNYSFWSQQMSSFLKGRKLWRYITGDKTKPTLHDNESADAFASRLDDWDSDNHKIITWVSNTVSSSIAMEFGKFDTAKEVWEHLRKRYVAPDPARKYKLKQELYTLRQAPGESVSEFYSKMSVLWQQLDQMGPKLKNSADIAEYEYHRDMDRLLELLMALTTEYESARASILHRQPLSSLSSTLNELLSEETRRKCLTSTDHSSSSEMVLATKSSYQRSFGKPPSTLPRRPDGTIDWSKVECRYCKKTGHTKTKCPILQAKNTNLSNIVASATTSESTMVNSGTLFTATEVEDILNQILKLQSNNTSATALSTPPPSSYGNIWIIDSGLLII